jgi:sortase A
MRQALRVLSVVLIVAGASLIADAVITIVWQEPFSAIYAKIVQGGLNDDLKKLDRAPLDPAERRGLNGQHPLAPFARALRRRVKDGQAIGRIRIPKIGASFVVVQGTDPASLRKGPGHYPKTPLPGLPGTVAIAGHRTTYLAPFHDVNDLRRGDDVRVDMPYGRFDYRVERTQIVPPTALWVTRSKGYDRLVLSACHPLYSAAKRIIVFARLRSAVPHGRARA